MDSSGSLGPLGVILAPPGVYWRHHFFRHWRHIGRTFDTFSPFATHWRKAKNAKRNESGRLNGKPKKGDRKRSKKNVLPPNGSGGGGVGGDKKEEEDHFDPMEDLRDATDGEVVKMLFKKLSKTSLMYYLLGNVGLSLQKNKINLTNLLLIPPNKHKFDKYNKKIK